MSPAETSLSDPDRFIPAIYPVLNIYQQHLSLKYEEYVHTLNEIC